ncbi:PQ-loop-domain-containing protein [Eremomyces bilateralis CBS 781.70]|uniref:PQ-loop-domain-containing protein n=1 Tax=Eremomyces bilateralis CBS 781.70 TaxID=1392243 RepID=A0A6G1G7P2_9PEZI|nr:PQ-loop-domain-containing protein [Eremomyces bilateralis CBS 781.70]KAF1814063.1 PQ-loop-domain-containing protein [Eremomyces bilateralis CBS 781.70]
MYPPSIGTSLPIEAISGICGSISIACWVVVFSPQIVENFRRRSAEGLSIVFVVIWLAGDVFNIAGAVMQKVLPTMIILAVYYTLADIVLLCQCFYYKGFTLKDDVPPPAANGHSSDAADERARLLPDSRPPPPSSLERRPSFRERLLSSSADGTNLSPVTPWHSHAPVDETSPSTPPFSSPRSRVQALLFNATGIILVLASGVLGWWLSSHPSSEDAQKPTDPGALRFSWWGQVCGYVCALLYLGSRVPQLLLNYRRKSTEGISMLFFIFAVLGNSTYVLSIMAFEPRCPGVEGCAGGEAARMYWRYMLVNLSWILGSLGTLFLDMGVFVQYFIYRKDEEEDYNDEDVIVAR